ncbi:protein TolR [Insolitispirillum peregrinum]|uniref:Cell division and transport-associated protein TolR n=1 Tax=Insolitispirillum peregrinum TaxID=80876 RepID=A0A1N7IQN0_9PROT|nr:protein TolR [Insolitispirillum peregrinum]SIS39372.1 Cell division and transport-associated protein TolR [Insolitispirillum peregrinum]
MSMSMQSGGGGRGGGRRRRRAVSDINVTPMVDVMLVLLVIFMVTAPLMTTGVDVDLPSAKTPQIRDPDNKAVTISVAADGQIYIQETAVDNGTLVARLQAVMKANPEAHIYVRGDNQINYGKVMEVLGLLHSSGFTKAALITRPPSSKK